VLSTDASFFGSESTAGVAIEDILTGLDGIKLAARDWAANAKAPA
jgi:hypothetical protein